MTGMGSARDDGIGFAGWVGMFLTVLKGMVVLVAVTALILMSGLLWQRMIGELSGVMLGLETLLAVFVFGYLEEVGGLTGLAGRVSGFVHERTCRDTRCFLCSEWAIEKPGAGHREDEHALVTSVIRG